MKAVNRRAAELLEALQLHKLSKMNLKVLGDILGSDFDMFDTKDITIGDIVDRPATVEVFSITINNFSTNNNYYGNGYY